MGNHIIKDDFLQDFEAFRLSCDKLSYDGMVNPADGVFYPGVTTVPESIQVEVQGMLSSLLSTPIYIKTIFLRLSVEGVEAPHQAHTDAMHSKFALMLYLNRAEDCEGGTSFVVHKKTGLCENPISEKQLKVWEQDHSNPEAWSIMDMCQMKPNRALIFEAGKMHRAEPIGGFGRGPKDGRLVLTCFFDVA